MQRVAIGLLYFALLLGGTYLAFRPTFDSAFTRMQTDYGDTVLNHYILEHSWQWLTKPDYCGTLLSPPFYYPQKLVLAYSENLLGVAPFYWALRAVLPYDLAFQWWMIAMYALNFVAFAVVVRWFGCSHALAAFGGYLWAFALVHVAQMGHQQLIPRFWCPFAVYYAWAFASAANLRSLNRLTACVFLQAVTCVHTGWFLVYGLLFFVAAATWLRPGGGAELRQWVEANRGHVALILGGWGAVFFVFFLPYFLANKGMTRNYSECMAFFPTASTWLCGPEDSYWYQTIGPLRQPVNSECVNFCGPMLILLFAATAIWVWRARTRQTPTWRLTAACVLAVSCLLLTTLGIWHEVSLWWFVRLLPGGGAIRVVSRVYIPVYLFVNFAVILALSTWLEGSRELWKRVLHYLLMAVVLFEQTGHETESFEKAEFYGQAEKCAASLEGADVGFITGNFGTRGYGFETNLLGMWAGLFANVPVSNGYSGRAPDGYYDRDVLSEQQLRTWLALKYSGELRIVEAKDPSKTRDIVIGEPTKPR